MLPEFLLSFVYFLMSTEMWLRIEAFFPQPNPLNQLPLLPPGSLISQSYRQLIVFESFIPDKVKNG